MASAQTSRLEPEVHERFEELLARNSHIPEEQGRSMMWHSIAISLKRIADAIEKIDPHAPVNQYGENFSDAIQNSLVRGQRGISTPGVDS
ncbi:hypothetical protein NKL07_22115 [Mesorhizobium sp. C280B]|uniref:hypothetical protein n=1 Tax=unclassified Mesorhizobium TaxID=325217 RepID=UPI0003CEC176|nr:hypothetical protein [Mesorhizobium sp. LSJC280B00]ESW92963.1 hypothetical protein X772_03215 [Mesorhizobium sp. LSJC280B00]